MSKLNITIDIDIKHARMALNTAGYDVASLSDNEIINLALDQLKCYGVHSIKINGQSL